MNAKMLNIGFIAFLIVSTSFFSKAFSNNSVSNLNEDYLVTLDRGNDGVVIQFSDYSVKYSGYFDISSDDRKIISISPNGFLEVEKVVFGSNRKIEISSDSKGNLKKLYFEGKSEKPFDQNGQQWLSDILPKIVRTTGVGAESRVARFYKNGGMNSLLEEIDEINEHNPAARNLYFVIMVDQLKLSDSDLQKAVPRMKMIVSNSTKGTLMRNILRKYDVSSATALEILRTTKTHSYNTERGSTLRVFNTQFKEEDAILDEYFEILEGMSINSEKGNVVKDLMQKNKLKPTTWARLFENLDSYSLTREQGAILLMAIDYMPKDKITLNAFNEAVEDMDDHYYILKGEIMDALLNSQINGGKGTNFNANKGIVIQMLNSTIGIESNSQKGLTLRKINRMFPADLEVLNAYQKAILDINDNMERYNVLLDYINRNSLNKEAYKMVLEATEDFSNDYQHAKGAILRACLKNLPNDEALLDDFFDIIDDMDQNGTIEELLRLVMAREDIAKNEFVIIRVIEATKNIDVDIEKATVLLSIKNYNPNSTNQSMAFEYAAKEISSDYLKRSVLGR